jgi:hypothetical protein
MTSIYQQRVVFRRRGSQRFALMGSSMTPLIDDMAGSGGWRGCRAMLIGMNET